jgi:hypothetical protein
MAGSRARFAQISNRDGQQHVRLTPESPATSSLSQFVPNLRWTTLTRRHRASSLSWYLLENDGDPSRTDSAHTSWADDSPGGCVCGLRLVWCSCKPEARTARGNAESGY